MDRWRDNCDKLSVGKRDSPPSNYTGKSAKCPACCSKGQRGRHDGGLRTKTFAGLVATGVRTLTTIPADTIGNNGPLISKHDVWTSAELKLVVAEDDESPFSGMRHSELISMKRTVPDAALFLTPVGIMVKPAPSLPGIGSMFANMEYTRLLAQVVEPQTREDAATKLVAYATTHPEVQNHVDTCWLRGIHIWTTQKR
jgi:hypothetical protein